MFKVNKLTDYATVVLIEIARSPEVRSSQHLADKTGIPGPTVAKLMKSLAKAGLVASRRGAGGGYGFDEITDIGAAIERAAKAAADHGIALEVVKLPEAKRGFVLLPRRWVVERAFAWMARFRRLARDYERLPTTLAGLHLVAFSVLLLRRAADFAAVRNSL